MQFQVTIMKIKSYHALFVLSLLFASCANNSEEELLDEMNVSCNNTEVSLATEVMPLLLAECTFSGCHNGDNGSSRDWTNKANVLAKAGAIKARTQNGSMPRSPGALSQNEIDLIACWVDNGALDN